MLGGSSSIVTGCQEGMSRQWAGHGGWEGRSHVGRPRLARPGETLTGGRSPSVWCTHI